MEFRVTNESLQAIHEGLAPRPGDKILCVGGSGDQGFSLALCGAEVIFMDTSSRQCRRIQKRIAALRHDMHKEFWEAKRIDRKRQEATKRFFEHMDAAYFEHLKERTANMSIWKGDLLSLLEHRNGGCNKIYLSNVIGRHHHSFMQTLHAILKGQPTGTMVYVTNAPLGLQELATYEDEVCRFDHDLTHKARLLEQRENPYFSWNPVIALRR